MQSPALGASARERSAAACRVVRDRGAPPTQLLGSRLGALVTAAVASACGGPSNTQCEHPAWSGQCRLVRVQTLREAEFPEPHIVLQGIYSPIANASSPNVTPPDVGVEFTARSRFAGDLRAHLERYETVECTERPPPPGTCVAGDLVVNVPKFVPPKESYGFGERTGQGCAQLEDVTASGQLPEIGRDSAAVFPQDLKFLTGSASPAPESIAFIEQATQQLLEDSTLECVAVVGQVAPNEPLTLAAERARAVVQAMADRGVDPSRLMAITATVNVYASAHDQVLDPADLRRVMLRVVLRRQANGTQR
ncbi:MAG: hypothetical protein JW940_20315 [Polyangiaceae bacterium]|nr:hypothetical protein [Polyangiaceae bacterium]